MAFRAICLFLICSQLTQAFAFDALKIVGRGIQDRQSKKVMVMACVGDPIAPSDEPSCRKLQAMFYNPETKGWVRSFRILDLDQETKGAEPTPELIRRSIKGLGKKIRLQWEDENWGRNSTIALGVIIGVAGVATGFCIDRIVDEEENEIPVGKEMLVGLGGVLALIGITKWITTPMFINNGQVTYAMLDQNGWNWSVKPKKVSRRTFRMLYYYYVEERL